MEVLRRVCCSRCLSRLVAEHFKRGYEADWLDKTFSKAIFLGNGLVSIVSGLVANYLVTDMSLGPVAPFDAATCFLSIGGTIIFLTWSENTGDVVENANLQQSFSTAYNAIFSDKKIFTWGRCSLCLKHRCTRSCFYGRRRYRQVARIFHTDDFSPP